MNRTVRLDLANAAAGAAVLGQVVLATAIRFGAGPLEAERLRCAVEAAARATDGGLRCETHEARGAATLVLTAADDGWAARAVELLASHRASTTVDGVTIELRRSPLHAVPASDV